MSDPIRIFCSDCSYFRWGHIGEPMPSNDCPECPEGQLLAEEAESEAEWLERMLDAELTVMTSTGPEVVKLRRVLAMAKALGEDHG